MAEVARRVLAARRNLFGNVIGNGKRSGRKVLRANLSGRQTATYYPYTMKELDAPGYEEPAVEDLLRVEQELNRVGRTRIAGKLKPIRAEVAKLVAIADFNLDTVNWDSVETPRDEQSSPRRGAT